MEPVDIEGYEGIYRIFDDGKVWAYPRRSNPGMFMKTQTIIKVKDRIKLARQHFRIKSVRSNFNHRLSKFLIDNFQTIVIEDLDLDEMKKNNLGRKISDLAFYQFRTFLLYKALWYGRDLVIADKWFASTKICAECGHKNMSLKLSDRQYTCPNCKSCLDRDENAAKNLYQLGVCYLGSGEVFNTAEYMFQFNN